MQVVYQCECGVRDDSRRIHDDYERDSEFVEMARFDALSISSGQKSLVNHLIALALQAQ
jgi:hypothetical protein